MSNGKGAPSPSQSIQTDLDFVKTLNRPQRAYFLARETAIRIRLQKALLDLSRGVSEVSALHGEALALLLASEETGNEFTPVVSAGQRHAYQRTTYRVFTPSGAVDLRVGERNAALLALHRATDVTDSAFVTACNPFGQRQSPSQNAAAMRSLKRHLDSRGIRWIEGEGRGEDVDWPPESSVLALGVDAASAGDLCARLRQNAVVFIGRNGIPRLLFHPQAIVEQGDASDA